ncbi:hypothetical protein HY491_03335 [Candidatus Woesearchaeota archaeon]|nr:hypothetical protein [Candidatus Woesearchaeota archaeon]
MRWRHTINLGGITSPDIQTKSLLIGRDSRNLKNYEAIVKRYFDVEGMRVM